MPRARGASSVTNHVEVLAVNGVGEVAAGDELAELILDALPGSGIEPLDDDVFVVAEKIVSKAEGRILELEGVRPSTLARDWAERYGHDARQVQVVLDESVRIVRMDRGVLIGETRHGFVCANAGVDRSNAPPGCVLLLPEAPDWSASKLRRELQAATGARIAVLITDTWGRPWRVGIVNFAIGAAGMPVMRDHRGERDPTGRRLDTTVVAIGDEVAAAAGLVMGKLSRVPVAVVRGIELSAADPSGGAHGAAVELIRPADEDLFR